MDAIQGLGKRIEAVEKKHEEQAIPTATAQGSQITKDAQKRIGKYNIRLKSAGLGNKALPTPQSGYAPKDPQIATLEAKIMELSNQLATLAQPSGVVTAKQQPIVDGTKATIKPMSDADIQAHYDKIGG